MNELISTSSQILGPENMAHISKKLNRFSDMATFFALNFSLAKNGWYKNLKDDGYDAYTYESKINGEVAIHNDFI